MYISGFQVRQLTYKYLQAPFSFFFYNIVRHSINIQY